MNGLVNSLHDSLDALSLSAPLPNDARSAALAAGGSEPVATAVTAPYTHRVHPSTPWMASLVLPKAPASTIELLDAEIVAFHKYMSPTQDEIALRRRLIELFEDIVQQSWPDAEVRLFGSMATGLFLPDGDIDLTILCPSFGKKKPRAIFEQIVGALLSNSIIASRGQSDCKMILTARVPILKFTTTRALGSFSVDVSLAGTKGVEGANISRGLLDELEKKGKRDRAERLVLLWKTLLRARGVNEVKNGGLGGLSAFLMVVSYLQLEPPQDPAEPPPSAGLDWLNFLHYYGYEFPYRDRFIATDKGGYLGYRKDRPSWLKKSAPDQLAIKHPVDHNRDLASGSYGFDYIKEALVVTYTLLAGIYTSLPASPEELESARNQPSALLQVAIKLSAQVLDRRAANRSPGTEEAMERVEALVRQRGEVLASMRRGRDRTLAEKAAREKIAAEESRGVVNEWTKLGLSKEVWERLKREKEQRERAEPSTPIIAPHFPALVPPRSTAKGPIPLIRLATRPNFPKELREGSPKYVAAMKRVEQFNSEAKRKNKLIRLENRKLEWEEEGRKLAVGEGGQRAPPPPPASVQQGGTRASASVQQSRTRSYNPAGLPPPIPRTSSSFPQPLNRPPPTFAPPNPPPQFTYPDRYTYSYTPQFSPPPNQFRPSPPSNSYSSSAPSSSYPDYFAHPPQISAMSSPPVSPPKFLPSSPRSYTSLSLSSPPEHAARPLPPPASNGKGKAVWTAPGASSNGAEGRWQGF